MTLYVMDDLNILSIPNREIGFFFPIFIFLLASQLVTRTQVPLHISSKLVSLQLTCHLQSSAEVINAWNYKSSSPYAPLSLYLCTGEKCAFVYIYTEFCHTNLILAFIYPVPSLLRLTSVHNITHLYSSSYTVLLHGRDQNQQPVCELYMNLMNLMFS